MSGVSGVSFQLNLNSETVDQTYPSQPVCLPPTATVREAMERMNACNEAAILVCQEERLIGIFTERDALKRMANGDGCEATLQEVMTKQPAALSIRDTVGSAIAKLSKGGYRRLPIVDDKGRPTGVLKMEGILHYLIEHFPAVIYNLPPEPHHATRDTHGA
jgi:CBS domain-containing protein